MIKFWSKFHFQILWCSFTWDNRFLLTPFLISLRKILPPEPLDTPKTASMRIIFPILNSMMEGWKYRSRELLKAIFCHQKNPQESRHFLETYMKFFLDICMKYLNPQVSISKMVNKHNVDYRPSPSELTSRIHSLMFLRNPGLSWFILHHGSGKASNSWC